jgi:hypothetical protein
MGNKSAYLENAQLNWIKGTTYPTVPTTSYVALFTVAPTSDAGTGGTEVTGGSYARIGITNATGWSAISGTPEQISNNAVVTFVTPTASWGTVLAIGVYDAITAGNLLYYNTITSQVIGSGVVASFAIGALIITDD